MSWIDVGKITALRQSMIKTFQRCPRQFYYAYIKGLRNPPNLKMVVGTAVHKGVEINYEQKVKSKKDCKLDIVLDSTRDEFRETCKKDGFKLGQKETGKSQDEAIAMASRYHQDSAPNFQPAIRPEYRFEIKIPGAKRLFEGTIDLLAYYKKKANALVLSDTKTTRRSYEQKRADVDTQLTAYAYAALSKFRKLVKYVVFDTVVLANGKVKSEHVISTRSMEDMARFEQTFKAIEKSIDVGAFPPTDDARTCSWCGFAERCWPGRSWSNKNG